MARFAFTDGFLPNLCQATTEHCKGCQTVANAYFGLFYGLRLMVDCTCGYMAQLPVSYWLVKTNQPTP